MKRKIINVKGKFYAIDTIREGHSYAFLKQRKNGVFYTVSKFNAKSYEDAFGYVINYKIK